MGKRPCYEPSWYRTIVAKEERETKLKAKNIRDIVQKHYDYLFGKMLRHEEKLKEGVKPLSYRPRVHIRTGEHIEEVLGEIENFLKKNLPRVRISPRPEILQSWKAA